MSEFTERNIDSKNNSQGKLNKKSLQIRSLTFGKGDFIPNFMEIGQSVWPELRCKQKRGTELLKV